MTTHGPTDTTVDSNEVQMRRIYDEVVTGGNIDLLDELMAEDYVEHEELPGFAPNRTGAKQFFAALRQAFPDVTITVEDLLAVGETVAVRVTLRGTHRGEFMGVASTGRRVEVAGMDFVKFADGKAVEHWGVLDTMAMMVQLGAVETGA